MTDEYYMLKALEQAKKAFSRDEVPVGAIIVKNGKIISKAYTKKEKKMSALYHAEIIAIKKAEKKLRTWKLSGCCIYTTLEPCELCASFIVSTRIDRLVYGAKNNKNNLSIKILTESSLNHKLIDIKSGVLENESSKLLKEYFKIKRNGN